MDFPPADQKMPLLFVIFCDCVFNNKLGPFPRRVTALTSRSGGEAAPVLVSVLGFGVNSGKLWRSEAGRGDGGFQQTPGRRAVDSHHNRDGGCECRPSAEANGGSGWRKIMVESCTTDTAARAAAALNVSP